VAKLRELTRISIFAALVFVTTFITKIPIVATGGYFNFGDSLIFVAALLYGPLVGGLAGGIGAAIADIIGGYPIFAPGTLIIKFFEGEITGRGMAGYIRLRTISKPKSDAFRKALSIILSVSLGLATYHIGATYMGVFGNPVADQSLWAAVALFFSVFIIAVGFLTNAETSGQTIAIILGGAAMVIGYFLYENLIALLFPGLGIYALAEIPLNIGQMLVGMVIALPVFRAVQKALPPKIKS
jgi:uncharacterized membrane protein